MQATSASDQAAAPDSTTPDSYVLVLSCPDRPGIVHAVSGFLVERGGNIVESQQFGDRLTDRFFMRIDFTVTGRAPPTRCGPTSRPWPRASRWTSSSGPRGRRTAR